MSNLQTLDMEASFSMLQKFVPSKFEELLQEDILESVELVVVP